ncbi:MAG: patatin family protein [Defluviitaleaceae bacterium]|nr:patatin family protein [Defluviitaleaceae bacterium]
MLQGAIVLEGGGMRSLYAAGILDVLLENNIEFSHVYGSSAGALVATNYIGKHIGRSARINILHSNDYKYYSIRQYIKSRGSIFNFDYMFHSPVNDLYPFDTGLLKNTKQNFIVTATNCKTGKPVYFQKNDYDEIAKALTASSSLPLLSKIVEIDGYECIDGGVSMPVAIHKSIEDGHKKHVVVLTRNLEYRKKDTSTLMKFVFKRCYKKYPELIKKLIDVPKNYNKLAEEIAELEKQGKIFVIRPTKPLGVGRAEKDARKLFTAYLAGRDDMRSSIEKMLEYMKE